MRVILLPVADRPECVIAMKTAFSIAERVGANVVGCHIRSHRLEERPSRGGGLLVTDDALSTAPDEDLELGSRAAAELFAKTTEQHGFSLKKRPARGAERITIWQEMVGTPARVFSIVGPVADLGVVSRPKPSSKGQAKSFMLAALVHSGKPVLVLPQKPIRALGERIVIAWNQSTEAAAAVAASMPLLARAAEIHIVTCGKENRPGPKASYLMQYLTHWGLKAQHTKSKGRDIERELTDVYEDLGGDLLIMGAYSRNRLRELVFGGVTDTMLFHTQLPVLMLHA